MNDYSIGITAVILAGGRATRMCGADKGLVDYHGRRLIEHVIDRISPQVKDVVISANRNLDAYSGFGFRVVSDISAGFLGPLAGLAAGMQQANSPLVLSVACDLPNLPADLVRRLRAALGDNDVAIAATSAGRQNVVALYRREVAAPLQNYLDGGGRKVADWQSSLAHTTVRFEDAVAFANINTPADLN